MAVTNGGTFAEDTVFEADELATPVKDGFTFDGWYSDDSFQTPATTVTAGQTYYAKWASQITFDANGGTLSDDVSSVVTVDEGKSLTDAGVTLPTPTKEGGYFAGWNTAADGSGDPVVGATVPTGSATYYAIWGTAADATHSIYPIGKQTYTGAPLTPPVYVVDDEGHKTLWTDVTYENNVNAGTATVKVTIDGQVYSADFTIAKATYDMSGVTFSDVSCPYDGTEKTLVISGTLPEGVTVAYTDNTLTNAGSATATAAFTGDDNHEPIEDMTATLTITKATPALTIAPSAAALTGGGTVTLTVGGVPEDAAVTVTQTDDRGSGSKTLDLTANGQASVSLSNTTAKYTFTVTYAGDDNHEAATASCTVSVTGQSSDDPGSSDAPDSPDSPGSSGSSSGSSGGSGSGHITTQTVTNPDGSKTTTVTDRRTGTVTETTKYKDGSTLVVETRKDGTVTETRKNADGSSLAVETKPDGAVTTTETRTDGVAIKTVEAPNEKTSVSVASPERVEELTVTIPGRVTPGTVAVDTKTSQVIKLSVPTEDGMTVKLDHPTDFVLEDRSIDFIDTEGHWASDAVDFTTAHGMFQGVGDGAFAPDGSMTRAMLMTVLARFDGCDTDGGGTWYEKGVQWAMQSGVSDGADPDGSITREQLVTMLYRYAGSPAGDGDIDRFADAGEVSDYAVDAMRWAVGVGIIDGMEDGATLAPRADASRAQVAAIFMRFCANLVK